ncbi:MAG: YfhO family protein [Cyanobacteria bacterium]|nr:YfhO family protein [Cyanobacteriota bacterium]
MMHLTKILKKIYPYFLIILFFFILSFVINKIPNGFIIAHGDFSQTINPNDHFKDSFYAFSDQFGSGILSSSFTPLILFNLFQAFLFNLGFSYSNIANIIFFLFSISSFFSFYFSIKIINKNISFFSQIILSIIYALNTFTFSIFTSSVGYTAFFSIYIFIPLIFAYFEKILNDGKLKDYFLFSVIFFIGTVGFSNIAFLISLLFIQVVLFLVFFIDKKIKFSFNVFKKFITLIFIELILSSHFLLPWFLSYWSYASKLTYNTTLGYVFDFIKNYQRGILYNLSLAMDPWNYPFNNLNSSNLFIGISLGYFLFILLFLFTQKKNENEHKLWKNYLIFTILLFILTMRFAPPFDRINEIVYYKIPIFKLFRSPDKLFVFLPFFFITMIALLINNSKIPNKVKNIILIFLIIIPFPFYIGGVPKYLTTRNNMIDNRVYAFKIPDEYLKIKKIIDNDNTQQSVLSIPDPGFWSYKKWNYIGAPLQLFKKNIIFSNSPNNNLAGGKSSFQEYNLVKEVNLDKFIYLLQEFNCKFILLHKDFDDSVLESSKNSIDSIKQLENKKILKKIEDNDYFALYELDQKYQVPIIYSENNKVSFQKINPVEYKIFIPNLSGDMYLKFNRMFSNWWKLYIEPYSNNTLKDEAVYYKVTDTYEYKYNEKIFKLSDLKYLLEKPIFENNHKNTDYGNNIWELNSNYIKDHYSEKYYRINNDGSISVQLTVYFKIQSFYYYCLIIILISFISAISYMIYKKIKIKKIITRK